MAAVGGPCPVGVRRRVGKLSLQHWIWDSGVAMSASAARFCLTPHVYLSVALPMRPGPPDLSKSRTSGPSHSWRLVASAVRRARLRQRTSSYPKVPSKVLVRMSLNYVFAARNLLAEFDVSWAKLKPNSKTSAERGEVWSESEKTRPALVELGLTSVNCCPTLENFGRIEVTSPSLDQWLSNC